MGVPTAMPPQSPATQCRPKQATSTPRKTQQARSAALNEVQEALVTEKREFDTLFVERNQAFAEWQHRYTHTTRLFAALLSLAGQDILAERLRPTQRQVQGSELVDPSQEDGEGDDSAEL